MIYEIKIKDLKPEYLLRMINEGWIKTQEAADPDNVIATFVLNDQEADRKKIDFIY